MNRRRWLRRIGSTSAGLMVAPAALAGDAMSPAITQPQPAVGEMVRLSANENPYGPSPAARKAMMEAFDEACRYPYAGAADALTRLIAEREGVTEDHVLLSCGSSEILAMTGMAYGMDSGEIIAADPTYQGMLRYAENLGGYVHRVPLDEYMVHDLEAMEKRITQSAKVVFVCNPNNPTATIADPARLKDFCSSVSSKAIVFMDEAYIELLDDPAKHTMMDQVRAGENVIVSRTFSKIHGLAGQRTGYAVARPDIIKRIGQYRMGGPNVIGLRAAYASLQDNDFQSFSRKKITEGRQGVYDLLDEVGYKYTPSYASFVFFHTGIPIGDFQTAMKDRGILVGRPFPPYLDWCRVSIGTEENMAQFASALRDFVSKQS